MVDNCRLERKFVANNSNPTTHCHYVAVEKLQIGLYVFIDLPWFQHPFTLNSFRIGSEEQIRTLRSLGEPRFRYDPARSDVAPGVITLVPGGGAGPRLKAWSFPIMHGVLTVAQASVRDAAYRSLK